MCKLPRLLLTVGLSLMLIGPALAAGVQFATGIEHSSGDYGDIESTRATVIPFSLRYSSGNWSVRASIPMVAVRGAADIAPVIEDGGGDRGSNSGGGSSGGRSGNSGSGSSSSGSGSSGSGGGSNDDDVDEDDEPVVEEIIEDVFAVDRDVRGLGDASVSFTYSFLDIAQSRLYVDLTGRVRLPVGDETKGLGTGATDVITATEIGWDGTRGGVFFGLGRRFLGSVAGYDRQDGWQASAGFWRNIGKISVFGAQTSWRNAALAGGEDPQSVDVYLTRRLSRGWKFEVSAGAGLSNASPDYAFGLNFIWRMTTGQSNPR